MHCLTGMPRAGSTLLQNVFNQNPKLHVTSTSPLCQVLSVAAHAWSNSPEIKGLLMEDKALWDGRMKDSLVALASTWWQFDGQEVMDKSRGWMNNVLVFKHLWPKGHMIVMVRDLRNIFASVLKQHSKNPILDEAVVPLGKNIIQKAETLFASGGIIGQSAFGVMNVLNQKQLKGVTFVQCETFQAQPAMVMGQLYAEMKLESFTHDFKNVKNTAKDPDALYLNKYPHEGCGKVKPGDPDEWKKWFDPRIAQMVMQKFPGYNQAFGYR